MNTDNLYCIIESIYLNLFNTAFETNQGEQDEINKWIYVAAAYYTF